MEGKIVQLVSCLQNTNFKQQKFGKWGGKKIEIFFLKIVVNTERERVDRNTTNKMFNFSKFLSL